MDELLREFLTETSESLDVADVELVKFESEPNNLQILNNIFRLVHTIKARAASSACRGWRCSPTRPRRSWTSFARADRLRRMR